MSSSTATLPMLTISARRPQGRMGAQFNALNLRAGMFQSMKSIKLATKMQARSIKLATRMQARSVICAAMNARCGAEQTQTVTRESSTITVAPVQGKEKSPDLDDGGTGLPPGDDGDGGGGGGGGGGWSSGGFFFFGFLAFLGFLKDKESEDPYQSDRRRR
ncbi:hypothetical protein C5167_009607 [Papaver somniferum]|uniref:Uncharacterized protein n=1 Tax=Papaver somniferum TaxID=3469 RepID=A0A4Y7JZ17_PAPSO|nr:uncharacterized protein LOC113288206 [Papaver somniferum]RZC65917.1 hypothetical protein C5167_009607 [Papaver somniferum]